MHLWPKRNNATRQYEIRSNMELQQLYLLQKNRTYTLGHTRSNESGIKTDTPWGKTDQNKDGRTK